MISILLSLEAGSDKESTLRHLVVNLKLFPSGSNRTVVLTGSQVYHQKRQNLIGPSEM